ncbi:MAG: DUF1559 domain-containing protein, partial [Planctomycetes bacterium]|nr:DUF1559 domain-containing protein [Planctomycetota bacterium]
ATVSTRIEPYLCPTMVLPRPVPEESCGEPKRAPGSYAVCAGTVNPWRERHDGAIVRQLDGITRFRDITDGTSQTLMVGEFDYGLKNYTWRRGPCAGRLRWGAAAWAVGYPGLSIGTTRGVFNSDRLINGYDEFYTFRSDHPGGVNFTLVDGSVRFISEKIDANLLDALATRQGGEPIGEF